MKQSRLLELAGVQTLTEEVETKKTDEAETKKHTKTVKLIMSSGSFKNLANHSEEFKKALDIAYGIGYDDGFSDGVRHEHALAVKDKAVKG
jgi:hypothetical protein